MAQEAETTLALRLMSLSPRMDSTRNKEAALVNKTDRMSGEKATIRGDEEDLEMDRRLVLELRAAAVKEAKEAVGWTLSAISLVTEAESNPLYKKSMIIICMTYEHPTLHSVVAWIEAFSAV